MAFCLTPAFVQKFKQGLKDGSINPEKLAMLGSEQRRNFMADFVGKENAKEVNALFESKLLLKNQQKGMITWAKKTAGITPAVKRDLVSRIERMDTVLDPEGSFLQDLASARLRIDVTQSEAKKISDLSKKVTELKQKTDVTKPDITLGRAKLALTEYVNSLDPRKANLATNVAGVPRSVIASLDLSAPLNQGWGMVSRKRFYTSLGTMFKSAKSEENFKNLQAYIITHPDYDNAKRAGLRLTDLGDKLELREEQFMSTLLDRVPGISASQRAYVGFLNKLRMDAFSDLLRKAEVRGENVTVGSEAAKDLANTVNNFTGGARVGRVEGAVPLLNALFFSPRKIKSTMNILNPVNYVNPKISKTARIEATRNLIGSLAMSASVILLYELLTGKEQEKDPTSSDFGKIKSGDTRIDVTGGNATYANILARIITGRIKGQSGVSRELGTGYGETSAFDLIAKFLRYKLSPNASLLVDAITKENAIGEKKTISESVIDRFKPLFLESLVELFNSDTDGKFGFAFAGLFGAGLNTYSTDTDWTEKTTKEMLQFREKVGEDTFKKANEDFNKAYDEWFEGVRDKETYQNLTDEQKADFISSSKTKIKKQIFEKYDFKYEKTKETEEDKKRKEELDKLSPTSRLIEGVKEVIAKIDLVPEALASEGEKVIKSLNLLDGDRVEITYEDGGFKSTELDKFIDKNNFLGKILNDVGTRLGLPELNLSEGAGYLTREQKIKEFNKRVEDILGVIEQKDEEPTNPDNVKKEIETNTRKASKVAPKESKTSLRENMPTVERALRDENIYSPEVLAYAYATIEHETAKKFEPVNEGWFNDEKYGYEPGFTGRSEARRRGYGGGEDYYGRGFIQLTHKENYKKYGRLIGEDLLEDLEKANDPEVAAKILAVYFKDKGIDDLIKKGNIVEARRKINPDNKGKMIAETYKKYLSALKEDNIANR